MNILIPTRDFPSVGQVLQDLMPDNEVRRVPTEEVFDRLRQGNPLLYQANRI